MTTTSSRRSLPIQGELLPPGERPRCRACQTQLRPNFTYVWAEGRITHRKLTGYGVWDNGAFCSKDCATKYAHQVVWVLERTGRIADSSGRIL